MKPIIRLNDEGKLALRLPDGRSRTLSTAPLATTPQARCLLLLDCSGSMEGKKLEQAKAGVVEFSKTAVAKGYAVGIVSFDSRVEVVAEPSRNPSRVSSALSDLHAGGTTNLAAGIETATERLSEARGTSVIVIATDGVPDCRRKALAAARRAASSGIQIITLGTGDADHAFLREIATASRLAVATRRNEIRSGLRRVAGLLPACAAECARG